MKTIKTANERITLFYWWYVFSLLVVVLMVVMVLVYCGRLVVYRGHGGHGDRMSVEIKSILRMYNIEEEEKKILYDRNKLFNFCLSHKKTPPIKGDVKK